jgi:hypothetical protein
MSAKPRVARVTDLYDDDFYAWTREQAKFLRAAPVADNRIDRERIAEEIEDLGSELRIACESLCERVIQHLWKLEHSTLTEPRRHWRAETVSFRGQLAKRLTPSIRRKIKGDLDRRYRQAVAELEVFADDNPGFRLLLPPACPYSLDQIAGDWWPERPRDAS